MRKQSVPRTIFIIAVVFVFGAFGISGQAMAGPFILDGTDADDRGSTSGGANLTGWLYMQKVLENVALGVTNGNFNVVSLGAASTALSAASSAFGLSSLAGGGGWSFTNIDGVTDLATFLTGGSVGGSTLANTGILMVSSNGNVTGGISGTELTVLTTNATAIDTFLGGGGGLHSMSNNYNWLSALLPSVTVTLGQVSAGITLTAAGNAAFPGLASAAVSAGPWHNSFQNTGLIPILGTGDNSNPTGLSVIIGASAGSITNPGGPGTNPVPEPATMLLLVQA